MDWVSRAVLAWRLSNTLGADFCVEALEKALSSFDRPESVALRAAAQWPALESTDLQGEVSRVEPYK